MSRQRVTSAGSRGEWQCREKKEETDVGRLNTGYHLIGTALIMDYINLSQILTDASN